MKLRTAIIGATDTVGNPGFPIRNPFLFKTIGETQ